MENLKQQITTLILLLRERERIGRVNDFELTASERHIVDAIGEHTSITMMELTEYLHVTKGSISQMIKRLLNQNMVEMEQDKTDLRVRHISLSKKGYQAYLAHQEAHHRLIEHLGMTLNEEEMKGFIKGLGLMNDSFAQGLKKNETK